MKLLTKNLLTINIFLISFLPFFLIIGPAPADIAVSLVSANFIIYLYINKIKNIFNNKFTLFFLIFYVYLLFTSLFSENTFLSFESTLFYFRFLPFVLCILYLIENNNFFLQYLFYGFIISFFILLIDSYFQYFFGFNIMGYQYDGIRLSGIFNEEKKLGSYLSRLTPIFIGLSIYLHGNSRNKIILILFLVVLIDILVVLSGERTSIFYMTISTFLISILISKWKIYRLIAFTISIILSFIIILTNDNVKERVLTKTIEQTNIMGEKINTFSIQHQVIYSTSLKIFKDNPIFGIGPKNFREKCKEEKYKTYIKEDHSVDGCQTHPHNTYIQLLVETGVIGFSFVFLIFIYLNYLLLKHVYIFIFYKKFLLNDITICMIVALYVTLWPFAPTGSFFNNWLSIIYFFPLGFILYKKFE